MRQQSKGRRFAALVALAVFSVQGATPRLSLVQHEHAGGEHFHVHAEEIDAIINEQASGIPQPHSSDRPIRQSDGRVAVSISSEHHGNSAHSHWQSAFQRVTHELPRTFQVSTRILPLVPWIVSWAASRVVLSVQNRGPPPCLAV